MRKRKRRRQQTQKWRWWNIIIMMMMRRRRRCRRRRRYCSALPVCRNFCSRNFVALVLLLCNFGSGILPQVREEAKIFIFFIVFFFSSCLCLLVCYIFVCFLVFPLFCVFLFLKFVFGEIFVFFFLAVLNFFFPGYWGLYFSHLLAVENFPCWTLFYSSGGDGIWERVMHAICLFVIHSCNSSRILCDAGGVLLAHHNLHRYSLLDRNKSAVFEREKLWA